MTPAQRMGEMFWLLITNYQKVTHQCCKKVLESNTLSIDFIFCKYDANGTNISLLTSFQVGL